eukprot:SAG31_NODE_1084_length_10007_cov_4.353452_6_plen_263_part_00
MSALLARWLGEALINWANRVPYLVRCHRGHAARGSSVWPSTTVLDVNIVRWHQGVGVPGGPEAAILVDVLDIDVPRPRAACPDEASVQRFPLAIGPFDVVHADGIALLVREPTGWCGAHDVGGVQAGIPRRLARRGVRPAAHGERLNLDRRTILFIKIQRTDGRTWYCGSRGFVWRLDTKWLVGIDPSMSLLCDGIAQIEPRVRRLGGGGAGWGGHTTHLLVRFRFGRLRSPEMYWLVVGVRWGGCSRLGLLSGSSQAGYLF